MEVLSGVLILYLSLVSVFLLNLLSTYVILQVELVADDESSSPPQDENRNAHSPESNCSIPPSTQVSDTASIMIFCL